MNEDRYSVTGMTCAACSARVEKAVSKLDGVDSCQVNLLTNSMTVTGNAKSKDIIKAVVDAGYGASKEGENIKKPIDDDSGYKLLVSRLVWSLVFVALLMYFAMGHTMWGFPLPHFFHNNPVAVGLVQLLLAIIVMVINKRFFINGFKGLMKKSPNMDTLVALGSGASFIYSLYALFAMTAYQAKGDLTTAMSYMHEFYFESAAMILALITLGKMLEARSKGKTTDAIKGLINLTPKYATILKDGREIQIEASKVNVGDIFLVKTGDSVPVDGIITEGHCAVNESALTGESIPKDKGIGDNVSAATINQSGYIKCRATKVGGDTLISQIIKMVSDASASKAPVAKAADRISGIFVPIVISIAVVTFIIWMILGAEVGFALSRGISVLVISCPCALGLATPVAIMVGNGVGAKNGILFKTASALEQTGKIQTVVLDKTGTITTGQPVVTDIISQDEEHLLEIAYAIESKSLHPLARAITEKARELDIPLNETDSFEEIPGKGLRAVINGKRYDGGNMKFISDYAEIPHDIKLQAEALAKDGKTPLFFAEDERILGIIAVADTIKDDSPEAVSQLQDMGIEVVMLTGDNERTANAIKARTGINRAIADVLPDKKAQVIDELKASGKVCMVGDGINDAPALTTADIGIAIGSGTDIAIDAADIVLLKNSLLDVCGAIRLSRATLRNIHENLFWAFIYNLIGIPIAAGVFIPLFNLKLSPMFGAAAMSLSSFFVVSNALRLNLTKIYSRKKDKKIKSKKEIKTMEKTLKIEGMMCEHCEGRVKKSLEETDGVTEAIVSHESGTALVKMSKDIDIEVLKKVVTDQGYTVIN